MVRVPGPVFFVAVGEPPQPAATGAHSTAGMGHRREGTPSAWTCQSANGRAA